ncbi:MAG: MarC family protein [Bacteroidetes bacterium]|nr:MarC family protein [Bacteroidota bacterium]
MEPGSLFSFAITAFTGFFAIMNPVVNLPVYLSLVEGASQEEERIVQKRSVFTAFLIVTAFIILGKIIFSLFGLTVPAFKIAGGILIFLAGTDMVRSKDRKGVDKMKPTIFNESIAISPLATPLMAGPGSIVTAMTFVSDKNWMYMGIAILAFGIVCLMNLFAFRISSLIVARIWNNVITAFGRIMG